MPKKANEERDLGGRPTKWKPHYNQEAYELCLLGYTDKELAEHFKVPESTLNEWKKKDNGFLESLNAGKWKADAPIAVSLRQRAEGMTITETTVVKNAQGVVTETRTVTKEVPPDTKAISYWLNNRQRARWRNRTSIEDQDGNPVTMVKVMNYEEPKKDKKPNGANDSA